jgi:Ca2+/Na+ antiporter
MDDTFGFLSGSDKGEIVGSVVLLVLIVLFIAFITQDNKHKSDKKT